jgi:predicted DNA-binding transcriptional regulator AlpA
MTAARKCDPVGAVEIAERLGVARRTVDQWRQRDLGFPAPRWQVGGRPAWNWDDITGWVAKRKPRV